MGILLKNSAGKPDGMWTFAVVAFIVVTIRVVLGLVGGISFGDKSLMFQEMDSGLAAVYLGATFSAYWARKNTDAHVKKGKSRGRKSK